MRLALREVPPPTGSPTTPGRPPLWNPWRLPTGLAPPDTTSTAGAAEGTRSSRSRRTKRALPRPFVQSGEKPGQAFSARAKAFKSLGRKRRDGATPVPRLVAWKNCRHPPSQHVAPGELMLFISAAPSATGNATAEGSRSSWSTHDRNRSMARSGQQGRGWQTMPLKKPARFPWPFGLRRASTGNGTGWRWAVRHASGVTRVESFWSSLRAARRSVGLAVLVGRECHASTIARPLSSPDEEGNRPPPTLTTAFRECFRENSGLILGALVSTEVDASSGSSATLEHNPDVPGRRVAAEDVVPPSPCAAGVDQVDRMPCPGST